MDVPNEVIANMDYKTRMKHYQQELTETLQRAGRLPLSEYDRMIKALVKKWRV